MRRVMAWVSCWGAWGLSSKGHFADESPAAGKDLEGGMEFPPPVLLPSSKVGRDLF